MRWLVLPLALVSMFAAGQPAPRSDYNLPSEREEPAWDEQKPTLPAFPRDENLVKIQIDGASGFSFFVEPESVSVGKDGVVRYTFVARSSGGATNIAYEGIRCKGRERKLYALGRADRTWVAARNPQWGSISDLPDNRLQATLHDAFFCPARIIVRDADTARTLLRRGGDPGPRGLIDMWNQPR